VRLLPGQVQVKATNISKNVGIVSALPEVKLYIKTNEDAKNIEINNFEAYVDLEGKYPGEYEVNVQVKSDNPQISIVKVIPDKVAVKLASLVEKEVPVVVTARGKPLTGYVLKDISVETDTVKISGAQNLLDRIVSVKAVVILDGTETGEIRKNVVLSIGDEYSIPKENIIIEPDQVVAVARIEPESKNKSVKIVPVLTGEGDLKEMEKSVIIKPASVELTGDSNILENITEIKTGPIDLRDLLSGNTPADIKLVLPANVKASDEDVKFTAEISDKQETKVFTAKVKVTQESDKFTVKDILPSEIKITVTGQIKVLESLSADSVSVNLNLAGITAGGKVQVNIKDISVPEGIAVTDLEPAEVEVTAN